MFGARHLRQYSPPAAIATATVHWPHSRVNGGQAEREVASLFDGQPDPTGAAPGELCNAGRPTGGPCGSRAHKGAYEGDKLVAEPQKGANGRRCVQSARLRGGGGASDQQEAAEKEEEKVGVEEEERRRFIGSQPSEGTRQQAVAKDRKIKLFQSPKKVANLARQETVESENVNFNNNNNYQLDNNTEGTQNTLAPTKKTTKTATKVGNSKQEEAEGPRETRECDCRMLFGCCGCFGCCTRRVNRSCLVPLLVVLVVYIVAVYCLPFVQIEPQIPHQLPRIPFNFEAGPLRQSSASQFKTSHLFRGQVNGAESLAFDSQGNLYMAIEGGFVLYAHLNKSSPLKKAFQHHYQQHQQQQQQSDGAEPILIKIAELNGFRQPQGGGGVANGGGRRTVRQDEEFSAAVPINSAWRRECQLDEQIYGQQPVQGNGPFASNIGLSRCSKPLGIRLSPDEGHLYVVDTLSGLYKINLRQADRLFASQRLVTRLVDFRANRGHQLIRTLPLADQQQQQQQQPLGPNGVQASSRVLNVSLKAVDDLAVDYGAGTRGGDLIYLTLASQSWRATSFFYDLLEGGTSGMVVRFDTGANQLNALEPSRVAHVRTSSLDLTMEQAASANGNLLANVNLSAHKWPEVSSAQAAEDAISVAHLGIGAPRLNENDLFDDRPLRFPNGLELTDDRQALLICDTSNKRIIKHYLRGPRRGTSDHWAWTPMMPDNIRRGYDKSRETYWTVGCGRDRSKQLLHVDPLIVLHNWPTVRKFLLKQMFLFGWFVESIGTHLLRSTSVRDFGYGIKSGDSLCPNACSGMMVVQYNQFGDIIRSIHSREFPNDLAYYSQVNEIIDANNQEHALYLGSPSYKYVTKITLPTESFDLPLRQPNNNDPR